MDTPGTAADIQTHFPLEGKENRLYCKGTVHEGGIMGSENRNQAKLFPIILFTVYIIEFVVLAVHPHESVSRTP